MAECLTSNNINLVDVTNEANKDNKFYFSIAETTFKKRNRNHCRDIEHKSVKIALNRQNTPGS